MNDTLIDINELKKSLGKCLNKGGEKIKFNLNISKFVNKSDVNSFKLSFSSDNEYLEVQNNSFNEELLNSSFKKPSLLITLNINKFLDSKSDELSIIATISSNKFLLISYEVCNTKIYLDKLLLQYLSDQFINDKKSWYNFMDSKQDVKFQILIYFEIKEKNDLNKTETNFLSARKEIDKSHIQLSTRTESKNFNFMRDTFGMENNLDKDVEKTPIRMNYKIPIPKNSKSSINVDKNSKNISSSTNMNSNSNHNNLMNKNTNNTIDYGVESTYNKLGNVNNSFMNNNFNSKKESENNFLKLVKLNKSKKNNDIDLNPDEIIINNNKSINNDENKLDSETANNLKTYLTKDSSEIIKIFENVIFKTEMSNSNFENNVLNNNKEYVYFKKNVEAQLIKRIESVLSKYKNTLETTNFLNSTSSKLVKNKEAIKQLEIDNFKEKNLYNKNLDKYIAELSEKEKEIKILKDNYSAIEDQFNIEKSIYKSDDKLREILISFNKIISNSNNNDNKSKLNDKSEYKFKFLKKEMIDTFTNLNERNVNTQYEFKSNSPTSTNNYHSINESEINNKSQKLISSKFKSEESDNRNDNSNMLTDFINTKKPKANNKLLDIQNDNSNYIDLVDIVNLKLNQKSSKTNKNKDESIGENNSKNVSINLSQKSQNSQSLSSMSSKEKKVKSNFNEIKSKIYKTNLNHLQTNSKNSEKAKLQSKSANNSQNSSNSKNTSNRNSGICINNSNNQNLMISKNNLRKSANLVHLSMESSFDKTFPKNSQSKSSRKIRPNNNSSKDMSTIKDNSQKQENLFKSVGDKMYNNSSLRPIKLSKKGIYENNNISNDDEMQETGNSFRPTHKTTITGTTGSVAYYMDNANSKKINNDAINQKSFRSNNSKLTLKASSSSISNSTFNNFKINSVNPNYQNSGVKVKLINNSGSNNLVNNTNFNNSNVASNLTNVINNNANSNNESLDKNKSVNKFNSIINKNIDKIDEKNLNNKKIISTSTNISSNQSNLTRNINKNNTVKNSFIPKNDKIESKNMNVNPNANIILNMNNNNGIISNINNNNTNNLYTSNTKGKLLTNNIYNNNNTNIVNNTNLNNTNININSNTMYNNTNSSILKGSNINNSTSKIIFGNTNSNNQDKDNLSTIISNSNVSNLKSKNQNIPSNNTTNLKNISPNTNIQLNKLDYGVYNSNKNTKVKQNNISVKQSSNTKKTIQINLDEFCSKDLQKK